MPWSLDTVVRTVASMVIDHPFIILHQFAFKHSIFKEFNRQLSGKNLQIPEERINDLLRLVDLAFDLMDERIDDDQFVDFINLLLVLIAEDEGNNIAAEVQSCPAES